MTKQHHIEQTLGTPQASEADQPVGEQLPLNEEVANANGQILNGSNGSESAQHLSVEAIREEVKNAYGQASPATMPHSETRTLAQNSAPPAHAEIVKNPNFKIRPATENDIDDIVDVDMRSFESVYSGYGKSETELRDELHGKFLGRLNKVGGDWMPVLEREGKIVGFMTCCPTSNTPEQFESWEETTDNGTLDTTYDPDGKNLYVVTLSVLPEGSAGKDMLFADQMGKVLEKGYKRAFFESRLPGLREWVIQTKCGGSEPALDELEKAQADTYANEYFNLTTERKGKSVRQDKLLRLYERIGCKCLKVISNAYEDEPSMNYGVMCIYDGSKLFDGSELPVKLPENRITRWTFGLVMQSLARSPKLAGRLLR